MIRELMLKYYFNETQEIRQSQIVVYKTEVQNYGIVIAEIPVLLCLDNRNYKMVKKWITKLSY